MKSFVIYLIIRQSLRRLHSKYWLKVDSLIFFCMFKASPQAFNKYAYFTTLLLVQKLISNNIMNYIFIITIFRCLSRINGFSMLHALISLFFSIHHSLITMIIMKFLLHILRSTYGNISVCYNHERPQKKRWDRNVSVSEKNAWKTKKKKPLKQGWMEPCKPQAR